MFYPTLENAFLYHSEKEWLDNCTIHFKPMIYKRYVDNIFTFFPYKEHLQLFVDYMEKQHKCLKFTSDAENDNSFSFLDTKITHHDQQFIENQLSAVHLSSMKVIWIKHIRSH